ncbi:MAG: D-alanine--D-alanine ligase [Acidaminococcaceae bacterium]|uniref:D-alanine--D-alanine ligase n=1 Tax=Succiniclasticum sp. TaxID=2775030 RepID=UPI000E946CF6|nr:D-alanine--D-alanine ligase [Succiniclasticum sp.]MBO5589973.1 D-alanine--D-alanine ligase [Acidaminococcaceae bacterium]MBR1494956.1 D-alanine--D-alanine ligase [Acidaminococcaceae bacterium]MDY6292066.1 D-alanine--D-alanine ligase [Succiniclasticum sp.]HAT98363.1 D-alanine--D-alanine ligase [Acidaminococcaceae bacterium]
MYKDKTIAVVMGGPSAEEKISLSTGRAMASALRNKGYNVKEIRLVPHNFSEQIKESGADVVVIAVHGLYGEDGRLQSALEMMGIPYTGSGVLASAMSMNKIAAKRVFIGSGIPTPEYMFLYRRDREKQDMVKAIADRFSLPVVVKPVSQGSSLGVSIEKEVSGLQKALDLAFQYDEEVLVEQYIAGQETSVCMMRKPDGSVKVWPVILIKPHAKWYDFNAKYSVGGVDHLVPAPLPEEITHTLQKISVDAYEVLGCSGVARTDCIIGEDGKCYVLEMNTVPGMTPTSLVPDAAAAEGTNFEDLCEMILESAHL